MLPRELSENLCSLLPNEQRKGVSLMIDLRDPNARPVWALSEVRVSAAFT